jgi:methyltransferase-like protein 6
VFNTLGVDAKDRFHPFLLDVAKEAFPDWLFCNWCQGSGAKAVDHQLGT